MNNQHATLDDTQRQLSLSTFANLAPADFIDTAYRCLLFREPDLDGRNYYLAALLSGTMGKIEVLDELSRSIEGQSHGVIVSGLQSRVRWRRLLIKIPLMGKCMRLMRLLIGSPLLLRQLAEIGKHQALMEQQQVFMNQQQALMEQQQVFMNQQQTLMEQQQVFSGRQHQAEVRLGILEADLNSIRLETRRAIAEYRRYLLALEPAALPLETPGPVVSAEAAPSNFGNSVYASFEDEFRGTPEQVRQGLAPYLPLVQETVLQHPGLPVVDLGCGRGEWLDLLTEERIRVKGADLNPAVTGPLVQQGFDVVQADVFAYLAGLPDASAAVVTSFHLIEHLPPEQWIPLLDQINRVLAPGGLAIIETPNPRNILVGSGEFYRDPSHRTPVFPDTLSFFGRVRGFDDSMAWYFVDDRSALVPADSWRFDSLDDYVRISRDYAWIGRKSI